MTKAERLIKYAKEIRKECESHTGRGCKGCPFQSQYTGCRLVQVYRPTEWYMGKENEDPDE